MIGGGEIANPHKRLRAIAVHDDTLEHRFILFGLRD
jgi:hypothetical protein